MTSRRRTWPIPARCSALAALTLALTGVTAAAGNETTRRYALEIPEGDSVTYEVALAPEHPGALVVEASWTGERSLSLRLAAEGATLPAARRAGPSPLRIEATVEPEQVGPWKLVIHALAARGAGSGMLTVVLPGSEPATGPAPAPAIEPAARTPPDSPWLVPFRAPAGSAPAERRVFDAAERLRSLVVTHDVGADNCRWQDDLLDYLQTTATTLTGDGVYPGAATRDLLRRIATAVARVEELRSSRDPSLAGPPPDDPLRRQAWVRLREERIQELEAQLDGVLQAAQGGYAPQLEGESWPARLVTCVTACERHFEERARLGSSRAINADLARAQWDRLVAAGAALEALSALDDTPVVDAGSFRVR